jgi:hypothetical protein
MNKKTVEKFCKDIVAKKQLSRLNQVRTIVSGKPVIPNTSKPWISIEIECFFPKTIASSDWYAAVATALSNYGLTKFVRLKDDGSIEPWLGLDGSNSSIDGTAMEVVLSAPESKIFSILEKVCLILNSFGAKTNRSCGLHIHLDHRLELNRNPMVSFNNLFYIQDVMFKLSKPYRRRCGFCDKVSSNSIFDFSGYGYDNRYNSINANAMEHHQTIEVRVFHGTTDFDEICHFINLLLGTINLKKVLKSNIKYSNMSLLRGVPVKTKRFIRSKLSHNRKKLAA